MKTENPAKVTVKAVDLAIKKAFSHIDNAQADLDLACILAITLAMPKHLGQSGDTRKLNSLFQQLIEYRLDNWAASLKWYVSDFYKGILEYKQDSFRLTSGNKEIGTLPDTGKVRVSSYVRVLTDEQKQQKAETAKKSAATREANKAKAQADALAVEKLKAENDALRVKYHAEKDKPSQDKELTKKIGTLSDNVEKARKSNLEKDKTIAELKEKVKSLESQVKGLEIVIRDRNKEIQELKGTINGFTLLADVKNELKELREKEKEAA